VSLSLVVLLTAVGLSLVSMAAFAALGRRDSDADRKGATFLLGLGDFLVHWFMWLIGPIERLALALGLGPEAFNFAGLGFGALSGLLIATDRLELGGWAIIAGGVCDVVDGRLARALEVDSNYGKFIDSTLDRFVEVLAFLGLVSFLRRFPFGALAAAAAITGSLLVSYARARGEGVGVLCKEGLMQRAERLALTSLACLADAPLTSALGVARGTLVFWTVSVIAVGTFATAVQRTFWIASRLRRP
jgi:CDP-diacylglycerol--glycerol-3-phosphate 3-phosphatidyltransferase